MATMSLPSMVCMALLFSFSGVGAPLLKAPALNRVLKLRALCVSAPIFLKFSIKQYEKHQTHFGEWRSLRRGAA
jgi:hypothetical protein